MIVAALRDRFPGAVAIVQTDSTRMSMGVRETTWKGVIITREPRRDRMKDEIGGVPVSAWVYGLDEIIDIIGSRRARDGFILRMLASGYESWTASREHDLVRHAAESYERGPQSLSRVAARAEWERVARAMDDARQSSSKPDANIVIMKSLDAIMEASIILASRWLPPPGNRIATVATIDPRLAQAAADAAQVRRAPHARFASLERFVSELQDIFGAARGALVTGETRSRAGGPLDALLSPLRLLVASISGAVGHGRLSSLWPILRLMTIMRRHWRIPLSMLGFSFAAALLSLPVTFLTAALFRASTPTAAYIAAGLMALVVVVASIVGAAGDIYASSVTESVWVLWQEKFVRRLLRMRTDRLRGFAPGELDFRFTDARNAIELLIDVLVTGAEAVAFLAPTPFVFLMLPLGFGLQAAAVIVLLGVIYGTYSSIIFHYLEGVTRLRGQLSARMIEVLSRASSIRASRLEGQATRRISQAAGKLRNETVKLQAIINVIEAVLGVVASLAPIFLIVQGYVAVQAGTLDVGVALGVGIWFAIVVNPIRELFSLGPSIQRLSVRARRFLEVYDSAPLDRESEGKGGGEAFPKYARELRLDGLAYRPSPTAPPLWSLDLRLPLDGLTAIAGPSGVGKSTLLLLMNGTLVPTEGAIRIDRVAIRDIDPADWRRSVAIVPQEDFVIEGTVMDNLALGLGGPLDAFAAESVLRRVGLWTTLDEREGLDTLVGIEGSGGFSTGERKRLCLARALVRKPRLLLVDEMIDLVEPELEDHLLMVLKELAKVDEMRVVFIAHRPSAIAGADREIRLSPPKT